MSEPSLSNITSKLLKIADRYPEVQQSEAYASRNLTTICRLETLRHKGRKIGPNPQHVKPLIDCGAKVRVVVENAVGSSYTGYFTDDSLEDTVKNAVENARMMEPDPDFESLAKPVKRKAVDLPYDKKIVEGEAPDILTDKVEEAISLVDDPNIDLAGSVMAVSEEFSLANSNDVRVERSIDTFSVAQLTAERVKGPEIISSGLGWHSARSLKKLDTTVAAKDAIELAKKVPEKKSIPTGEYNVILGPYAVADVTEHLIAPIFGMDWFYYGISWLPSEVKEKEGRKLVFPKVSGQVTSELITIRDDPTIRDAMASKAYDGEGIPTKPVTLVEKGEWKGVIGNSYFGNIYGLESCHGFRFGARPGRDASQDPSVWATNIVFEPGQMSYEELVELSRERGRTLYIPRTWYTYPTRHGSPEFSSSNRSTSFLIDKGKEIPIAPNAFKIKGNLKELLKGVYGVGRETRSATTWAAATSCKAPHIASSEGFLVEKTEY